MAYAIAIPDQVPSAGRDYQNDNKDVDLAQKRRWFRAYEENKREEIKEQRIADKYYHTKQWTEDELRVLRRRGQPDTTWNRVKRKIDFLAGVEQRMRRDPRAYGRNPQDTQTADTITAALRFVCDNVRWPSKASQATIEGLRRGVGVVFVGVKRTRKGQLEIDIKPVDADRFFYDPRAVRHDFSDARYMGIELWLDIDEAKEEWPGVDFDRYMERDGGFATFALQEDRADQWGDFEHRRVRVVEMWYREKGEWHYCKFCGDLYLEGGRSPYLDCEDETDCPYEPWTPYIDETGIRYGLVRDLKSIQDEINHRRSKALHEANSRQMYISEGVVEDIDQVRSEAAKSDGIIQILGGKWGEDIGFVDRSKELQANLEFLMEAKAEIENVGPNPGLVGKGAGVEAASGRALLAQRDSGMTELQPIFDHNRDWKLRVYRKIWGRIKQTWTGERWIRVTDNPESPQYIGINQVQMDPMTGQFSGQNMIGEADVDIIIEEGPDTITMQEELYQTLAQMGDAAMSPLGIALIKLSGVPNAEQIIEIIQGAQQSMQDPQAQQLQARGAEAEVAEKEASAAHKQAQAQQVMAEIGMNQQPQQPAEEPPQPLEYEKQAAEIQGLMAKTRHTEAQTYKTLADAYLARDQFAWQASQPPANQN